MISYKHITEIRNVILDTHMRTVGSNYIFETLKHRDQWFGCTRIVDTSGIDKHPCLIFLF
jgi:hypothetical protein